MPPFLRKFHDAMYGVLYIFYQIDAQILSKKSTEISFKNEKRPSVCTKPKNAKIWTLSMQNVFNVFKKTHMSSKKKRSCTKTLFVGFK